MIRSNSTRHPLVAAAPVGLALVLTVVSGCKDPPAGKAAASASAPPSAAPASSSPAPAAASGAPELAGSRARVELSSGVTLTLPASAKPKQSGAQEALQKVGRSQLFQLDQPGHLLSISELSATDQACPARLETEWQRMRQSRSEADPKRLALRQVALAEDLVVAGTRVLYSEAQQRRPGAVDAGRSAVLASVMFCAKSQLVVIMLACKEPELPAGTQALLKSIVASAGSSP